MEENSEEKKPEKKRNGRFWGMKTKNKKRGLKNRTVRRPNSTKKTLNDHQDKTRKSVLRRQVGETQQEWEERTRKKRIYQPTVITTIKSIQNGEFKAYRRGATKKLKETKHIITTRFTEKPFDYLKSYAFILRWASVRFDIIKDDIELGYYFYEGEPFSKESFEVACRRLGSVRGVFNRFWRNGYIIPCSIISPKGIVKDTEYFALSIEFIMKIKQVYAVISKTAPMQLGLKHHRNKQNEELQELLIKMNTEIEETILGIRNKDTVLYRNDAEIE